jgi:hypothetical protein
MMKVKNNVMNVAEMINKNGKQLIEKSLDYAVSRNMIKKEDADNVKL